MEHNKQNNTLPGLPPLPKSLSNAATSNNYSPLNHHHHQNPHQNHGVFALEHELFVGASTSNSTSSGRLNQRQNHRHGSLSSTQESLSDRESVHSRASSSHSNHQAIVVPVDGNGTVAGTATLDTQLAILRREMYGLRQLDLSLLSQLWALNESIQGFRVFLQEQETLSPPSPSSPTPSETNSLSSEADEEDCFAQPTSAPPLMPPPPLNNVHMLPHVVVGIGSGSTTSHASSSTNSGASSATSSIGKNVTSAVMPPLVKKTGAAHPQLPRILQQRMRRAPPPPPPTQAAQLANKQMQQQQQQQLQQHQQQQALINKNIPHVQQTRHV